MEHLASVAYGTASDKIGGPFRKRRRGSCSREEPMPSWALILSLFADLASPASHAPRVHRYPLPFAVRDDEPHFLVEREGWIVYIGWPVDERSGPIFRMARSRDRGAHWRLSHFAYDWYPREVRLNDGRLDIHFDEEDCMGATPRRLEARVLASVWDEQRE
jgi:hypothetical protein